MNKIAFAAMLLLQLNATAQQNTTPQQLFQQGYQYLNGRNKPYDPAKGKQLFAQAAAQGDAKSMNALANIFMNGLGVVANTDSAIYWYQSAANGGYASAYNNLGQLYKSGTSVTQDFAKSASYYSKSAASGNIIGKNWLAYMYYKGLGIPQNYNEAFRLYTDAANNGNTNAMYFLGLCYRNGYGTNTNTELSKQWLQKAAKLQPQAMDELNNEPMPENVSTVSPQLHDQLSKLKNYQEKYTATGSNDYSGYYTGYAVYYDWSGRYVSEMSPLKLKIQKQGDGYKGSWQEGDSLSADIAMDATNNLFSFSKGSSYTRRNHYSSNNPELWQFDQAKLQLGFVGDSIQLEGYVQFYSPSRKEPGKPLQIILKKAISPSDGNQTITFSLYPNPTKAQANAQFTLSQAANVAITVTSQLGKPVYAETPRLLPAGCYSYVLPLGNIAAGVYNVQVFVNGNLSTTKLLVKQ